MKEENDRLRNDLADLTKLSEMLNVKFKLMSHEKEKLKEQSEEVTFSFQDARDQVHELSCKFNSKLSFGIDIYIPRKAFLAKHYMGIMSHLMNDHLSYKTHLLI